MVFVNEIISENNMPDSILEWIAERDESLFEKYLEDKINIPNFLDSLINLIKREKAFICMAGSALKDIGIMEFFEQLSLLTKTNYKNEDSFKGIVFKIRHDEQQQRLTFIKALQGTLRVRDEFHFNNNVEKITELRLYNGTQFEFVQQVEAGEIFAVKGFSALKSGDLFSTNKIQGVDTQLIPALQAKVVYSGREHIKEVLRYFQILEAEEPTLKVQWNEKFQEINVHIMGVIQLEVLTEVAHSRFGIDVHFENPKILYKETIQSSVIGYGHFEPLKHYAEVHLKMEPQPRGSGIIFENHCHTNHLSTGHQRLIEQHIFERDHNGLLTGYPLTDIKFTLLIGRAHNKHTEGGDFREATFRAIRQGLEQAVNVLLEPYYHFKIKAPKDHIGRIMNDIQGAFGKYETPIISEDYVIIEGTVPVATFMNYSVTFAAYTSGRGTISLQFHGYDICHNTEAVLAEIGYDKNADSEYTSSSIFCTKGKGYVVPWYEAEAAMHCLKK